MTGAPEPTTTPSQHGEGLKSFCVEDAERFIADSYEAVIASWLDGGVTLDGAPPDTGAPPDVGVTLEADDPAGTRPATGDSATTTSQRSPDPVPSTGTTVAMTSSPSVGATGTATFELGRQGSDGDERTWPSTRALATDGPSRPGTRIAVTVAMVACLGVVAALLVPDGGQSLDTTAGTTSSSTPATVADETGAEQVRAFVELDPTTAADSTTTRRPTTSRRSTTTSASTTRSSTTRSSTTGSPTTDSGSPSSGGEGTATSGADGAAGTGTATTGSSTTTVGSSTTTAGACPNPSWRVVLRDDFDGPSLATSHWSTLDGTGNGGNGLWRSTSVWLANGYLNITAKMMDGQLVSGGIRSTLAQPYGRYEVRVRTDPDPSHTLSALVATRPTSGNATADGQAVLYETPAAAGDRSQFRSVVSGPGGQDVTTQTVDATAWHTVVLEWTPAWIRIHRDGTLVNQIDDDGTDLVGDGDQRLTIELDAWGPSIPHDQTMQVDYVTVSALDGC
ncbi:MAG: hypothetical protein ACFCVK_22155 [Acidimicrobiales bacterium]